MAASLVKASRMPLLSAHQAGCQVGLSSAAIPNKDHWTDASYALIQRLTSARATQLVHVYTMKRYGVL